MFLPKPLSPSGSLINDVLFYTDARDAFIKAIAD